MLSQAEAEIDVQLSGQQRHYAVRIQAGSLAKLGTLIPGAPQKVLLLSDAHVAKLYASEVSQSCRAAGCHVYPVEVSVGEGSKSFAQAQAIFEKMVDEGFTRQDCILALGGGVVGDLAGFCASTYHRGMGLVQVPTTLVAQVDSAIGGKTAINLGQIKNAVGSFYQPQLVVVDPACLTTLPAREFKSGLAEVVKYSLIENSCTGQDGLFRWLEELARNPGEISGHLPALIERCVRIKATVVMQDEQDRFGLRAFLNLGHTFGHAYESASNYDWLHGEAVGKGLQDALNLSARLGMLPRSDAARGVALIDALVGSFPEQAFSAEGLLEQMAHDKKMQRGRLVLVLPDQTLGQVTLQSNVPAEELLAVLG